MTDSQTPKPSFLAKQPAPAVVAPAPAVSAADFEQCAKFGRIDDAGTIFVKDGDSERMIAQYPDGLPDQPLNLYICRYLDLVAQVDLFATRMNHIDGKEIDKTLKLLRKNLSEPQAIGDLPALRARVDELAVKGEERKVAVREEQAQARAAALEKRTEIVVGAEEVAAQDPQRTQWKNSAQKLRDLLGQWKDAQRQGPRIDRATEDALWKRFSAARSEFDRNRRQFFSALDASQAEAKRTKEKLVERAEALSSSTDWGATAGAYRDLMTEWKGAGRASRQEDDALWERFRAAQQRFFDARRAANEAIDASYAENLVAKEALLERAEALLPITDVEAAKSLLRPIQDEWDEIGHVPRADVSRVEGRMRAVEDAIRNAEAELWQRTNPETQARAQGMLGQLEAQIAQLEADHAAALAAGDDALAQELSESLAARKTWLEQVRSMTS